MGMQVQQVQTQNENTEDLQRQIAELTAENMLLKERLAAKEQFTAMIAHDLRGPLTPIINYAKLIIRQQGGQPNISLRRNANIIISQAQRMTRLVGDLLDMSRLSTGTFALIRTQCDIIALVKDVVEQLRPVAPRHKFIVDVPEGTLNGTYDGERLQQAIGNLLDNAIKYSYEETFITIRVWTSQYTIHISVHNIGRDIHDDEIDQLFQPFVRLQAASTRKGSGLGLYIARSIIREHGGELHLEPYVIDTSVEEMQSTGTTFSFTLPL
ncbi:MAG: hypothetical protein NVSMB54_36810 [Ktedonobacteraceae bacterium]